MPVSQQDRFDRLRDYMTRFMYDYGLTATGKFFEGKLSELSELATAMSAVFPPEVAFDIKRLRQCSEFGGDTPAYCVFSDGEEFRDTLIRLARHILSAGRDATGDAEPVTEEWLRSIGFYQSGDGPLWLDSEDGFTMSVLLTCDNIKWLYCSPVDDDGKARSVAVPDPKTRGDVRRLLAALGIPAAPAKGE